MTEFGSDLILARLEKLHPKSIDLSLGRIERLLARLGHPERRLPPVVHIAGTNGKGSTLAMLDAMLVAAGHRVHRYISPHLVRFNERILLHGTPIAEPLLAQVLDECERANGGEPITFFEITTAAAFLAFTRAPADYLLLETGLGGRLDATNVVARPELCLITPVSMDHESYLGNDIRAIAGEKAGIVKPGVPVIVGPQQPVAAEVFRTRATERGAPLVLHGRDWHVAAAGDGLEVVAPDWRAELPRPALRGAHQVENAGLAAMAGHRLGLDDAALARGLRTALWQARLQPLTAGPLARQIGPGSALWLDGGHNPAAGLALAASLDEIARGRPVDLIVGMLNTKDIGAFLAPLKGRIERIRFVPIPGEALARNPIEEAERAARDGFSAEPAPDVAHALDDLTRTATAPRLYLICGSLYLAAHVLRTNV